jgi:uncharacterized repeat protein (TIGR02543 family)
VKIYTKSKFRTFIASVAVSCMVIGAFAPAAASAAVGDLQAKGWDRLVGGAKEDCFNGIVYTKDGGTVSVGNTLPEGRSDNDGIIAKMDARGTLLWEKQSGGIDEDGINAVIELKDGSLLVAGYSSSVSPTADGSITDTNNGQQDGLLIKYSASGQKLWDKLVGGAHTDEFSDVIATADGGFLAVGRSFSTASGDITDNNNGHQTLDGYVVKFDADGNIQWDNLYGSPEHEAFYCVIQTVDGGYIAAGYATSINLTNTGGEITDIGPGGLMPHDGLLVKFDVNGNMVWNNLYGSTNYDDFYGIVGTSDGGCVVVGRTLAMDKDLSSGSTAGIPYQNNALITKFNTNGNPIWNCVYAEGSSLELKDIIGAPDGDYIVAGSVIGNPGSFGLQDGYLAKISSDGNLIESLTVGGEGFDVFTGITFDNSGILTAAGLGTSSQSGGILSKSNGGQDGLLVQFGPSSFIVSFLENGGTDVPDQIVEFGSLITVPLSPIRSGYTFEGWYLDAACTTSVSYMAPILHDTSLYAKWYRHVQINPVTTKSRSIEGIGEPGFLVVLTLPNGEKSETYTEDDGTWKAALPANYQLKANTLVKAAMYDIYQDGVPVSTDEVLVSADNTPPDEVNPPDVIDTTDPTQSPETGDAGSTAILSLFGLLLGFMIMVAAFKGPKAYR